MFDIPEPLRVGRQPLEALPGVELLTDASWDAADRLWQLELELTINNAASSKVPATTRWYVRLSPHYPQGAIDLLPSHKGGLRNTYPHQLNNNPVGLEKRRWRPGKICVDTGTASLDRHGADLNEPRSAPRRLAWHVKRATRWLEAAARNELAIAGDPFELPDYRPLTDTTVLFHEDRDSLRAWDQTECHWGRVAFSQVNPRTLATASFMDPSGESLFAPAWGQTLSTAEPCASGVWVLAPEPIATAPWQAPMTWGTLGDWFAHHDVDLLDVLAHAADSLRDRSSHRLLLGYPIPQTVSGPPERLHWIALHLPVLASKGDRIKGFRNHGKGLWAYDRSRSFHNEAPLLWTSTENAHDSELTRRGALHEAWCEARVLCIGMGALGSAVAELLLRGGARNLVLCDPDDFEAGNLVRHTLTSAHLGQNKAEALSKRLNDASPNANVLPIASRFPPSGDEDHDLATQATVVIDCSANDDVIHHLSTFAFRSMPAVFHVSFGSHATRLFLYGRAPGCVDPETYLAWVDPWLALERETFDGSEEIRPSAGCWHPAFPARADHVWLLAAAAIGWMNERFPSAPFESNAVLSRTEDFGLAQEKLPDG